MEITQLLNWNLKNGSHGFPSEGTCLNEAAIVAAGLKYRQVDGADDLPDCFSKTIGSYVITINDTILASDLADEYRPKLEPFVLRLAGTADSDAVEVQRATYMTMRTINEILPLALLKIGLHAEASACKAAKDLDAAKSAAWSAKSAAESAAWSAESAAKSAAESAKSAAESAAWSAESAKSAAWSATWSAAWSAESAAKRDVFDLMISILDGALAIGKQADEIDVQVIRERQEKILELTQ